jgi:hypothetical protein
VAHAISDSEALGDLYAGKRNFAMILCAAAARNTGAKTKTSIVMSIMLDTNICIHIINEDLAGVSGGVSNPHSLTDLDEFIINGKERCSVFVFLAPLTIDSKEIRCASLP